MSSIERTAYPRFVTERVLKEHELEQFYSVTPNELKGTLIKTFAVLKCGLNLPYS